LNVLIIWRRKEKMPSSGVINSLRRDAAPPASFETVRVVSSVSSPAYTVAAGKSVLVKARMTVRALGADATYALTVLTNSISSPVSEFIGVGVTVNLDYDLVLNEGDVFTIIGDSGSTNGTADVSFIIIKENDVV